MGIRQITPIEVGEMAVQDLVQHFEKEDRCREDIILPLNKIRMNNNLKFESDVTGEFELSEKGFKQLCQQAYDFAIPSDYMLKLWEKDKEQFVNVVNYHLANGKDSEKKLRGMRDENGDLSVRGIVSKNYTPFDNLNALDTFMQSMKANGIDDYLLKNTNVKEDFMFLRFVLPHTEVNLGSSYEGKEDWNYVSIDLVNGETGNSSLRTISSVYRQICTNGMVSMEMVENLVQRHTGGMAIQNAMKNSIYNGINTGEQTLLDLAEAKKITVDNPYQIIEKHAKRGRLTEAQAKNVRENYDIEADRNLMSIVNAFTRTGRDIKNLEKRVELERFASTVMQQELKKRA